MRPEIPFPYIAFFMQPSSKAIHFSEMDRLALDNNRRPIKMKLVDLELLDQHDYDGAALLVGRMALGRLALMYPEEFANYPRLVVDINTLKQPPYRADLPDEDTPD